MKTVAIFASGTGTNAVNLIEASRRRSDVVVAAVVVDNAASPLPDLVRERFPFVPVHLVSPKGRTKAVYEQELIAILADAGVEWIFLAGYLRLIGPDLLAAFPNRIINIHPSLLPAYPGLHAYERAFADGVAASGVTIHLVDPGLDSGPVLLRESFPRLSGDTLDAFVNRGKVLEWRLYPQIFNKLDKLMNRYQFTIFSPDRSEAQVYWLDSSKELDERELDQIRTKIGDLDQEVFVNDSHFFFKAFSSRLPLNAVHFKPGVTDNAARSFGELVSALGFMAGVAVEVHSGLLSPKTDFNPLIQNLVPLARPEDFERLPRLDFSLVLAEAPTVKTYDVCGADAETLLALSRDNCWALSREELLAIQAHFRARGRNPSDVELEMLAQTWSEHCKHKIFNAEIDYQDETQTLKIGSLFKEFIKAPTFKLAKPWAISLFDDNAGVVRFREGMDLCVKVETHNSPSALDPYGGALTGILGVNRDILGTGLGARPVANTDVFCVGLPDEDQLPKALLHPTKILAGIHHGVRDGGNKSGIPTVNGAIYFHESYSGKPLVYCGTVGLIPPEIKGRNATVKGQRPGDLIVMVGGAVGIDGIHGATASSLVMDKSTTIGMVQIGDPFSQKRMLDFLLDARDRLLYNSLTDNGAGGLSSSIGEMASLTNGAVVNLETVPLKYPGLHPWQILVSESQERMTLSVPPENWEALRELARTYNVPVTAVGEFTATGTFVCTFKSAPVCDLDLAFLHGGLPKLELKANFRGAYASWKKTPAKDIAAGDHAALTAELLRHPTLASKEKWIRQYDHEVQGGTVVKPMEGLHQTAPNDAGVLWYGAYGLDGHDGFAVASGLAPHFSIDDTYLMAKMAVDEAVRNLVCHGADPEKIALVDNFCWPDPTPSPKNPDAEFKLAQLVRTCLGLREMIECYSMPLVSGKDSMKNDYHGEAVKISVLPTLLVTALGHVPDVRTVPRSQIRAGELVYRIGDRTYDRYFGHFLHGLTPLERNNRRDFDWAAIRRRYGKIFSAVSANLVAGLHDVSEGGFLPALTEALMMEELGLTLKLRSGVDRTAFLYSELPGHFVAAVRPEHQTSFEALFSPDELELMGTADRSAVIGVDAVKLDVRELARAWRQA
jgi:phosphoribosylformylglycinamidine synthase II/formyltetrahydrofolate-dependent phosphoribosylglycinamide formyltransferase